MIGDCCGMDRTKLNTFIDFVGREAGADGAANGSQHLLGGRLLFQEQGCPGGKR